MKLRKFMALGLVAAMTATMFAGCGSKEISYWERPEKT